MVGTVQLLRWSDMPKKITIEGEKSFVRGQSMHIKFLVDRVYFDVAAPVLIVSPSYLIFVCENSREFLADNRKRKRI